MSNLSATPGWDPVFELETSTVALGGPGGPMNLQAQALLNRSEYLRQAVSGVVAVSQQRQLFIATAGQTVFTITNFSFVVGSGSLSIVVGGAILPKDGGDYTENSPTSFTLTAPCIGGEEIEVLGTSYAAAGNGKTRIDHSTTNTTDVGTLNVQRSVEYSGGTPGFVNSAIRADTFVDNAGAAAFEWAVVGVVHNHATGGENVGGYFQGLKYSTGPTWGAVCEVIDNTGANPTTGALALEVDVNGNGTDVNKSRIGIDIAIRRPGGVGAAAHAAYGIRFQNGLDATSVWDTAIGFYPGMILGLGIDLSPAVITGAAIKLAQGQSIQWESSDTPALVRQMAYNGGGLILTNTAGVSYWALNDDRSLVVQGTQILGARQTGYTAMTGALNRGTVYDPSTITLAQLAQRVNALQTDLTLHGLIGA